MAIRTTTGQARYLMTAPVLLLLVLTILIPEVWSVAWSFTDYAPGVVPAYVGLRNYVEILRDPLFIKALCNNAVFLVLVVVFEFSFGFGSALLLFNKYPLQKLWLALAISPYAISPIVACVIWRYLLDPSYGLINYALTLLGLTPIRWFSSAMTSLIPIVIVDVWKYSPFIMIIAYSALTALPPDILQASQIDGASPGQKFRLIMLPLISPALAVAVVFRVIFALRTFGIVWVLTGGGPGGKTEILSLYLYKESFRYFHFGKASAVAFLVLIITAFLSIRMIGRMSRNMFQA